MTYGRSCWRQITNCCTSTRALATLIIHSGSTISFWHDSWTGHKPLKEICPLLFKISTAKDGCITDLIIQTATGNDWHLTFRRELRASEFQQLPTLLQLIGSSPPALDPAPDIIKWPLTKSGMVGMARDSLILGRLSGTSFPRRSLGASGMNEIDEFSKENHDHHIT
ncbi:hypothetical protein BVC80_1591g21 [Macleaya cordata]|uniref:Reverse transcriptase zinc-binding domain n=1 Tax=Macleaya cordata TaxID=56857 RepID=A0A200QI03_MACCD|nr:hypothetical protein BVC80_1591g21 [Macleaya cordata]